MRLRFSEHLSDRLMSAREIAEALHMKPATVRKRASRQKFARYGTDAHPLYDVKEVHATRRGSHACSSVE